jgi:DNA-binding HxlR family transcriptional regulator
MMPDPFRRTAPQPGLIRSCSIWRALEELGDFPTLLILEAIWLGDNRFEAICARTSLTRPLISGRLKSLVAKGYVRRSAYCERPLRHEFLFEQKGVDLFPVTMMLLFWERKWSSRRHAPATRITHSACGHETTPVPRCRHCGETVHAEQIDWEEGPGLGWIVPHHTRRRQQRDRTVIAEGAMLFVEAAEILGDRWSGLALRSVFTGLHKFDEIQADSAIAPNILSDRLNWLVERGKLKARLYQSRPDRYGYYPTAKALDYLPILLMLQLWGDRYFGSTEGPPVILRHRPCGSTLELIAGCSECSEALKADTVHLAASGPETGAKRP